LYDPQAEHIMEKSEDPSVLHMIRISHMKPEGQRTTYKWWSKSSLSIKERLRSQYDHPRLG